MNKTQELANKLENIWENISDDEKKLSFYGPRGGRNARFIPGWICVGNQTITKACIIAGIPIMNYWSGSAPTPSTAIPKILYDKYIVLGC